MIRLAEEPYLSIQGEGTLVGLPTVFVRLQGCSVGCWWCDSKYTWRNGENGISDDDLIDKIQNLNCRYIWFTGGEPLEQIDDLYRVVWKLKRLGMYVFLCTSGLADLKDEDYTKLSLFDLIVFDVKLSSSKAKNRDKLIDNMRRVIDVVHDSIEFKAVVGEDDWEEIRTIVEAFPFNTWTLQSVYPVKGSVSREELEKFANKFLEEFGDHINVRLGLQLHKHIWDKEKGI